MTKPAEQARRPRCPLRIVSRSTVLSHSVLTLGKRGSAERDTFFSCGIEVGAQDGDAIGFGVLLPSDPPAR